MAAMRKCLVEESYEADFIGWVSGFDYDDGNRPLPVMFAIVEDEYGQAHEVRSDRIQFIGTSTD